MKTKFKSYGYYIGVAIMGIAIGSLLQFAKAWAEPTAAPPNSNVGAPINTSANSQVKSGILTAGALVSPTLCIGNVCKSAWPNASGDNLGNHTATQDLDMNGKGIKGANSVSIVLGGVSMSLKLANGGEDTSEYVGTTTNGLEETCDRYTDSAYVCKANERKSCVDLIIVDGSGYCSYDGTPYPGYNGNQCTETGDGWVYNYKKYKVTCKLGAIFSE